MLALIAKSHKANTQRVGCDRKQLCNSQVHQGDLSSRWAQLAGRLRGVLVKRGADEASRRFEGVRCVLRLHPDRRAPSPLAGVEVGGLWARVDPRRNPLPLLCSPTPSATLTLFRGEECPGRLAQMAHMTHTERTVRTGHQMINNYSRVSRFTLIPRYR